MKHRVSVATSVLAILFFLLGAALFQPVAHAVVTDVNLTGLPPNTTVTLTNDNTGEKTEGKSDDRGAAVIPLGGNSQSGHYTVRAGTTQRRVFLRDGSNAVNIVGGGFAIGVSFDGHFFDQQGFDTSPGFSVKVHPRISFLHEYFTLSPYAKVSLIPQIQGNRDKAFDHGGNFQDVINGGTMFAAMIGLLHESDLVKWGIAPPSARIYGGLYAEGGLSHTDLDMKRLRNPQAEFVNARNFDDEDTAFRLGFGASLRALWPCGLYLGLRGGVSPEYSDIANGDRRWRNRGEGGLFLGLQF